MDIFIDFAETLGYRILPEFETDLQIMENILGVSDRDLKGKYESYCLSSNLYDRSLTFKDFKEELKLTEHHFGGFLNTYLNLNNFEDKAREISISKYRTLAHVLYPDAIPALENYKKGGNVYIISDGRPSRRKTLELLNLNSYAKQFFISDEIGFLKNDKNFYFLMINKIVFLSMTLLQI